MAETKPVAWGIMRDGILVAVAGQDGDTWLAWEWPDTTRGDYDGRTVEEALRPWTGEVVGLVPASVLDAALAEVTQLRVSHDHLVAEAHLMSVRLDRSDDDWLEICHALGVDDGLDDEQMAAAVLAAVAALRAEVASRVPWEPRELARFEYAAWLEMGGGFGCTGDAPSGYPMVVPLHRDGRPVSWEEVEVATKGEP